jgi:hypothetical protein
MELARGTLNKTAAETETVSVIAQAMGLTTSRAAAVAAEVLTKTDCEDTLLKLALEVAAVLTEQARFAVLTTAPLVVTAVLIELARVAVLDSAPLEVAAVLTELARFAVFDTAALVVAVVLTELARFAVVNTAALIVAVVLMEPARFAVFDTAALAVTAVLTELARGTLKDGAPLAVAVVETLPFIADPRTTCAEVVTAQFPATLKFLVSVALAVGLAAPVISPASDAVFERGATVLAAQLTDAANDCSMPPLPFKLAALRAEPFNSICHLAN